MRSALPALCLVAALAASAPAIAAVEAAATVSPPLPGLTEGLDRSLWCAVMVSTLARNALAAGDRRTFEQIGPVAVALSRQVATHFVAVHFAQPDVKFYIDLYETEIGGVLAGTSPERYTPDDCKGIIAPQVTA